MKRFRFWTFAALAALLTTTIGAQTHRETWGFDKDGVGAIAKGFTNEMGRWVVVADDSAPSKPNVLAQTAKNSGNNFNIALVTGTSYRDVDVSVKMKAVAGDEDQGGGLVWRREERRE